MATAYVSIGKAGHQSRGQQPVFTGRIRSEAVTTSGTAASGALTATTGDIASVTCATAVIASGSAAGAASASNGLYIPAGGTGFIGLAAGEVVSIIDA